MTLAPARDVETMQTALAEWGASTSTTFATTSALPEWAAGANGPVSGEFPFYLNEGWDRAAYDQLRASDVPVFCYVQGMESMNCLALQDGYLNSVGVQSFPG